MESHILEENQYEGLVSEELKDEEDDCPIIKLSVEERKRIREPLRQTLIVKVIGRMVGYTYQMTATLIL